MSGNESWIIGQRQRRLEIEVKINRVETGLIEIFLKLAHLLVAARLERVLTLRLLILYISGLSICAS